MIIKSLLTVNDAIHSLSEIKTWLEERNTKILVDIERVCFKDLKSWSCHSSGALRHDSGRFFSIEGIHVETDYGYINSWKQPIINQPEIGYLGILTKEINGILYFLMQAKVEPGNVNCVQISPTLQATKSNYKRVHNGKSPNYLDYFVNAKPHQIIMDQLQSEQGARFLRKRNRNIIIKIEEDIEILEDFKWMTLGQIKTLMSLDNMVNMDTRTVLSGLKISDYLSPLDNLSLMNELGKEFLLSSLTNHSLFSMREILSWLTSLKSEYDLKVTSFPLNQMDEWVVLPEAIEHYQKKYFRVIGVKVTISNREVTSWWQPLIEPMQKGICAFICKKINGVIHFLVQAKLECGNFDVFELAPTVQCLTGKVSSNSYKDIPYLRYVLECSKENILYDTLQSEEGGRFYREQNRNLIVLAENDFPEASDKRFKWMTLEQMYQFLRFNNYFNIQSRSLIAALNYSIS